jgi:hypothetical protein
MCHLTRDENALALGDFMATNLYNDCTAQAMSSLMEVMMKHVRESVGEMLQWRE